MSDQHRTRGVEVSRLAPADVVRLLGGVYEHSPWVAETLVAEGISPRDDEVDVLAQRLAAIVEASGPERQLELLRLHPELVGKLKVGEELTASSKSEQAGARLHECTPEEYARFQALNTAYREKFGFPFIVAVKGLTRADILGQFETRVGNDVETEFRTALDQVHKIARLRICSIADGDP
jgi:2-oxo-4-hydroxy-4-carboxy-5-ureidoimidazoline decarboxylase